MSLFGLRINGFGGFGLGEDQRMKAVKEVRMYDHSEVELQAKVINKVGVSRMRNVSIRGISESSHVDHRVLPDALRARFKWRVLNVEFQSVSMIALF